MRQVRNKRNRKIGRKRKQKTNILRRGLNKMAQFILPPPGHLENQMLWPHRSDHRAKVNKLMRGLNVELRDERLEGPTFARDSPQQKSETEQTMMVLMFLMQLGCCDGYQITKSEDLVPEPTSVQSVLMTVMLLCFTMRLSISQAWSMMTPTRCRTMPRAVTTAFGATTSAVTLCAVLTCATQERIALDCGCEYRSSWP